jgi:hypothetical protein
VATVVVGPFHREFVLAGGSRLVPAAVVPQEPKCCKSFLALDAAVTGPCWLFPIPASDGSQTANFVLARAIAALVLGARVKPAILRNFPVESSTERRHLRLSGLQPNEHHFVRTAGPSSRKPRLGGNRARW